MARVEDRRRAAALAVTVACVGLTAAVLVGLAIGGGSPEVRPPASGLTGSPYRVATGLPYASATTASPGVSATFVSATRLLVTAATSVSGP